MQKPVLVVMAAGMGSRYGGLKQLVPVGPNQQAIMDYSLYDAKRAGFERVVFVISTGMAADFPQDIQRRMGHVLDIQCAVQRMDDLPEGFCLPEGRVKPWGTAHAVRACRDLFDAPFAAINADDFYGAHAFATVYAFLKDAKTTTPRNYAMVGYDLTKTLSMEGSVARGISQTDENGHLVEIVERTHVVWSSDGPLYMDENECYHLLPKESIASMNMWGFSADFMREIDTRFTRFLTENVPANPLKAEFFLPSVVGEMLQENTAQVEVLRSSDRWYGMTYRSDLPVVQAAIAEMTKAGQYPEKLW